MSARQFGLILREWRKRNHLSQAQLGKMIGMCGLTVSNYETGRRMPTARNLIRIARSMASSEALWPVFAARLVAVIYMGDGHGEG